MQLLNLGDLECDIGFLLRGGSASTLSDPVPKNERRQLASRFSVASDLAFERGKSVKIMTAKPPTATIMPQLRQVTRYHHPGNVR